MNSTLRPEFKAIHRRATHAVALLRIAMVLSALDALVLALRMALIADFVPGSTDPAIFAPTDAVIGFIATLQGMVEVITLIAFMMWVYRAYRNLWALNDHQPRFTARWAVAGFFVPFLNIVRPPAVMSELLGSSQVGSITADAAGSPGRWRLGANDWVSCWWALCIVSSITLRASTQLWSSAGNSDSMDMYQFATGLRLVNELVDIPRALLAIAIVHAVTRMQTQRHELGAGSHAPLPDPAQYAIA